MGIIEKLFGQRQRPPRSAPMAVRHQGPAPGPVMPWPRYDEAWKPYGQPQNQALLYHCAQLLGIANFQPGQRKDDDGLTVTLVSPAARRPIQVWFAGIQVGEAWNNDVERLRGRMLRAGRREGPTVTADAPAWFYRFQNGEWGFLVHA